MEERENGGQCHNALLNEGFSESGLSSDLLEITLSAPWLFPTNLPLP
jgi:hypothetical protein